MATVMPQNVRVRLNVGGTTFHTSLHTVMEGARRGSPVFQCLCAQILGPQANGAAVGSGSGGLPWEQRVVSAQNEQYRLEHFVDADPAPVPAWLEHLRTGHVKFVEAGPLREEIISDTQRAGFVELAAALRDLVDYRRVELQQALYMRPGAVNLGGAMLRGQDLSKLCFAGCSLRNTDLRGCNLQKCSFVGSDLRGANLKGADLTGADLTSANMSKTDLSVLDLSNVDIRRVDFSGSNLNNARLPAFDSGQLAGVNYNGASLHGTGLTELTFQSPFDCNGALYYIATGGGERVYAKNPHAAGLVVASMSSIYNGNPQYGDPRRFVQHTHDGSHNFTQDTPGSGSWMAVDLRRSLRPTHYCLRSGQQYNLRNWRLEASNDGSSWTTLREHSNDTSLASMRCRVRVIVLIVLMDLMDLIVCPCQSPAH